MLTKTKLVGYLSMIEFFFLAEPLLDSLNFKLMLLMSAEAFPSLKSLSLIDICLFCEQLLNLLCSIQSDDLCDINEWLQRYSKQCFVITYSLLYGNLMFE